MATPHTAYISLDSCITDYLSESEQNQHKYFKLWNLAFNAMEDLGMDFFYRIQAVKLPINANLTVTLTPDYLNWTKVGILNNSGAIIPLYYNNNLTTYADLLPNRLEKVEDAESTWMQWNNNTWCNYWNGSGYVNIYGVPSGEPFVGAFKVDTANGVIIIQPNFANQFARTYLMLEYLSSPAESETYRVPAQFRRAIISWLWWKDAMVGMGRSHMRNTSIRDLERMYYNDRRKAIAKWKPFRIMEAYQVSQEQTRLSIKS